MLLLSLPALTIRNVYERPEGTDEGVLIMSVPKKNRVLDVVLVVMVELSYTDYINRTVWPKA